MFFEKAMDSYDKDQWCCHICGKRTDYSKSQKEDEVTDIKKEIDVKAITYKGKTQSVSDWERELCFGRGVLWNRLVKQGKTVEEAFTKPLKNTKEGSKQSEKTRSIKTAAKEVSLEKGSKPIPFDDILKKLLLKRDDINRMIQVITDVRRMF
jgi:hypothetical protein